MSIARIRTRSGVYLHKWEARKQLGASQGNLCVYCSVSLTWQFHAHKPLALTCATLEHIIPIAEGGLNHMDNLAVSCNRCNGRRGTTPHDLFKKGFGK